MKTPRLLWSLLLGAVSHAADEQKTAWDVSSPPGERREIPIDVRSGTWMNVDVSPDGQHVVFDLLGDIYELRIAGGEAKALTSGMAWGVMVNIGAHGQREGLSSHWEMWTFVLGGMTPMQALHTATINPARYMGFAKDLGSLETGKLADLLIIDGNPLQDIRVTDKIAFVVQNGRIYEGGTLAEKVTGERKVAPFYWQK